MTCWARFRGNDGRTGFGVFDGTTLPGDVIACGTSVGVGSIRDGSTVEVRIEGIGSLSNALAPG